MCPERCSLSFAICLSFQKKEEEKNGKKEGRREEGKSPDKPGSNYKEALAQPDRTLSLDTTCGTDQLVRGPQQVTEF